MVARIAKSQSGSAAQYVGTSKAAAPSHHGGGYQRALNGTPARILGPPAGRLGAPVLLPPPP